MLTSERSETELRRNGIETERNEMWTVIARTFGMQGARYSVAFQGKHVPGCPWFITLRDAQLALADLRRQELIKVSPQ